MRVRIEDKEAIAALSWEELKAYLDHAKGWKYAEDIADKAAVYQHKDKRGRLREVIVPLRRDLGDYVSRMADAVSTLARVENRSELDVYDDLSKAGEAAALKVHARIRKWLVEERWGIRDVSNREFPFSIIVTLEGGHTVDIFQSHDSIDCIVVTQHWSFDNELRDEFSKLPDRVQQNTIYDIYRDATISGLDMVRLGIPLKEMRYVACIYFDGLVKDTLIQKMLLVVRMHELTKRTITRAFAEAGQLPETASELLHHVRQTESTLARAS